MSDQKPWESFQDQGATADSDQKPWESFQDQGATADSDQKPWESFGGETKPEGKGVLGHVRDLGLSAIKSVIAFPETAVGLLDIPTGGRVGKFLENEDGLLGFRPKQAKEFLSDLHTDQYKAQQQEFQEAEGVLDKAVVALSNPSLIANNFTESIAPMLGGVVVGRGILGATKLGQAGAIAAARGATAAQQAQAAGRAAAVAGAFGEGAMMAGAQAEAIRQQTDDGLLTLGQSAAPVATGALGFVFSYAGARLAQKLGIGDVDTMLARGITPDQVAADLAGAPAKSIPRQVIEGAISEGFFEELPQSVSEQIIQNLALDKPWHEGVDEAVVMGTLAGMAMGGPAAGLSAMTRPQPGADDSAPAPTVDEAPEPAPQGPFPALPAPVYEAGPDGTIRTTNDLNAATQAARQAEAARLDRIARGEVTDVTPIPQAPKPSEQMGLDPNAGPMSSAAALAVDSGASQQLAEQSALQQAAEIAQQQAKGKAAEPPPLQGEPIDGETGEIITAAQPETAQPEDRAAELQQRIEYIQQQARRTGWDKQLIQAREQARAELAALQPAQAEQPQPVPADPLQTLAGTAGTAEKDKGGGDAAPTTLQESIAQVRAEKAEAATAPADIKAVIAKQIPQMTDAEIEQAIAYYGPDNKRTAKLKKAQAKRASVSTQQPEITDGVLAPQAQQAGQERAQASGAPEAALAAAADPAAQRVDPAARWGAMTPAERQAVAEKAGVKPVFAKNLPNAGWDRIGASVRAKLSEVMAPELTASLAEAKAGAQELAARAAAHEARKIEGRDIGDGWVEFAPESGTLRIPRTEMPQIKAEHRGAMVNFLNARGIAHQEETVPAADLKPTQADFSREKVAKAKAFEGGNRSILVSRDGHVLDGHHQWMAARENGEDVKVIRLDAPIRDLVQAAHDFPSSTTDQQAAPAPAKGVAPGTRINTQADRDAADRLELLLNDVQGGRSTPEGGARVAIRSVVEELRKPQTVVSVQALLETAAQRLNKNYSAQADVLYEVAAQLGQPAEQAAQPTAPQAASEEVPAKGPLPIPEKAFADLLAEAGQDEEGIPTFTEPAETVRSEKRAEAAGTISLDEAQARIDEWEAHAKAQGKTGVNSGRVVLSLFDTSGEWSQPWVDAGYEVHRFDIQDGMDINDFSVEYLTETLGIERADIILAAPPCTDFSSSGAHAWKKKDADGRTEASIELVRQTLRTVEFFKPASWALENPVGRIQKLTGLPKPLMTFQPANFGNPYTKRTLLWGDFNTDLPLAGVEATDGSKITDKLSGKDKYERSLTPKGFAYSFFMANNLADMGAVDLLAREFKGIPRADFQAAADAGMAPEAMRSAIEDSYYDQDLEGARQALRDAMPTEPGPGAKAEPQGSAPAASTAARVIDNNATNPGEFIVRAGTTNLARFKLGKSGQPVGVKYFHEAKATRNEADKAIQQFMDESAAAAPTVAAAPEADTKAKDADRFAGNKIFTSDAVAAARARMKSKLSQLNSGIDPELMMDGMTIAGAYIESGIRDFAQYAALMSEDFGDKIKPYLLSFWEAARNYPGVDKDGMTSAEESARLHAELLTPAVTEAAAEAVGTVAAKPAKRTKKTGAKGDMVLTQDWGVEHIDGYGDGTREVGNDTKDAFLKDARNYLNAVADALRAFGFEPHLDRKGKPEKPVSVNESGMAGSGDVSLVMRNEDNGNNVYITIGDTSLRGAVPSTPSGIAIMYRVGPGTDRYATKAGNTWAPVDLSANDLAALVNSRVRPAQENEVRDEQPTDGAQDQGRAQEVRGRGRDPQPGTASADSGDVASRQPADGDQAGEAGDSGRPSVRQPGADVASGQGVPQGRDAGDGRARTGRTGSSDAGARAGRADGATDATGSRGSDTASPVTSPAATAAQAHDLHIENPLDIVGGTPVQRFNRNRAALELLQTLQEEGRQANADEQKVLAGYIGWGSFGQELFQGSWERPTYRDEGIWKERGEWLRNTLGESAWKSAQRSITNAHYTDPPTVMAMWDMVRRMGFEGGKVLEPSMGTGNFYSMMPADLKARSQLTGIELDETTGEIAKQLFPQSNVRVMGYQDSKTPDGFYDLIIGNWPFENTPVADRRYNKLNPMLHDYFFLKTMDQVRPGGIVIGITSAGSMDKQNTGIRRELAKQAELVASIRLPSGAFQEYAGTSVVTDIVILRKRPQRLVAVPNDATWVETGEHQTPSGQAVKVNRYYLDNPQNIIGTLDYGHGTTTFRAGMIVHRPENMAERLKQAVELVPQGAMEARTTIDHITYYANETGERHGALSVVNGKLMVAVGDQLVEANEKSKYAIKDAKKTAEREQQLVAAVDLRKRHTALVDAERAGQDGDAPRKALSNAYKSFTKAHGPLRESFALSYLERIEDPFFAELAALENDDGTPATVMQRSTTRGKRTIENPSVRDAYVLARNQSVNPSLADVARMAGKEEQAVKAELLDSGAVFEAPNGDIVPSDIYLSGNVRQKMREAEAALAMGNESMQVNIQALKDVMPEDVPYFNIETKLGATWVPNESYKQFIAHMLSRESTDGIEVSFPSGRWKVRVDHALSNSREAEANYGTPHMRFARLVQAAMSNQTLRLKSKDSDGNEYYDAEKTEEVMSRVAKMREDFGTWLWSDPERRQDLEREYNEARNAWATPKYDGSFLTFEGMALTLGKGEFNLRQHQVNAIWRAIVNRRSLNAHEVGTGKAQPLDAKVLTPSGWKLMGDIRVGDQVITQSGRSTTVEAVFPQGEKEIFRVIFSDGSSTECCDEHLWLTHTYRERIQAINAARLGKDWDCARPKVRPLSEIRETLVSPHLGAKNHSIPVVNAVQFNPRPVPLDPYLMGILLGDGGMSHASVTITSQDEEIVQGLVLPENVELRRNEAKGRCPTWALRMIKLSGFGANRAPNPAVVALESLGLMGRRSHDKFIPDDYLFNAEEDRIALLQGLMDTDGSVSKSGLSVYFYTISDQLADGVVELVQSLGGTVSRTTKNSTYRHNGETRKGAVSHVLCIKMPGHINPFRLTRKADMVKPKEKYPPVRYIVDVQPVGKKPAQCIRVSDPSHLYVTDDYIVTHNTFTMGGIAIESRRYGIAKKPVILAHNANSATVAAEIRMMYPSARVLYVDNLQPKNRDIRLRQIANDDWDAIVIPHSLIDRLALREETLMQMAADDIAALEAEFYDAAAEDGVDVSKVDLDDDESVAKVRSVTAKELAKARKRIIENIKKQAQQSSKEGAVTFEDLGIDMILVDEVHEFKKPPIVTRMQMKGLNTQVSGRSIALQFLTRYVRQMNNGGNVHTFTGTPITNTITEIYHQMRYVMESEMDKANVADWDGWFGSFATEVQDVELSAAGDYEMVTRLAGFVNVPELRQMVGQYMDTVFADDMPEMQPRKVNGKEISDSSLTESERAQLLNGRTEGAADRPYKKVVNASADMTDRQQMVFRQLQQYAQDWRDATGKQRREWQREGDPRSPIITEGIANKASFDVRLLDESLAGMEGQTNDDPNSKASRVVANTLEIYNSDPNANQVIFAEMGFSRSVRRTRTNPETGDNTTTTHKVFSTIHDIVERLVQGGIPREQIAIVDGSTNKERRKEIAQAMNDSRMRVVIGSTDTLGVGVNMQRNLRAMHHLDAPYMPGELEQRNGRGQRQGNQWNTVLEFRYMTDRLDGRRWQILAVKQRFITAFMKANNGTRVIEGEAAADEQSDILESFSEAAGDPRVLQRVKMQKKLESLQRKERMYTQGIADMRRQARNSASRAEHLSGRLNELEKKGTLKSIEDLLSAQRESFTAVIDGKTYDKRADAIAALADYAEAEMRVGSEARQVGTYAGHPIKMVWRAFSDSPTTTIEAFGEKAEGKGIAGAEAGLRGFARRVQGVVDERDAAESTARNMRAAMDQPFNQAADIESVAKQLADLEKDLEVNPVPPPAWLRQGAPIDSEVFRSKKPYIVTGHRYSKDGWFVVAEDDKGATLIPYMEATDNVGMALYEEREFVAPEVVAKGEGALTEADRVPSDPQFSFAGRGAQGADLLSLRTAQRRIAAGDNAETVRQETGWHRGVDGKWRFEINDSQAEISVSGRTAGEIIDMAHLNALTDGRQRTTVGDLLDHPQLFAAYPRLAEIPVSVTPEGVTAQARLHRLATGFKIEVRAGMPRDRMASALVHELQHGIQTTEKFATGGSKQALVSEMDKTGAATYRRLAGEVEARNVQARMRMTDKMRREIAPDLTADTPDSDVLVTFNGRDIVNSQPQNIGGVPITERSLERAFAVQFPRLVPALRKMLARGKAKQRGGLIMIDSADPARIAGIFARNTGRSMDSSIDLFEEAGKINGFYDPESGLTFLVGPNLDLVTGPAVLLHEMSHGQQRKKLNQLALAMLMNRGQAKNADLRASLDSAAKRMIDAGEIGNEQEAAAYIVEQVVIEGRSKGYTVADSRFLAWADQTFGKPMGDFLRSFLRMVRSWMLRHGMPVGEITLDDLVGYAMAGMERAAAGDVVASDYAPAFSRSGVRELAGRATAELNKTFTIPGKLHWWHKTIGTMYNLAERSPFFKPVFESAQGFIDDVSHYAADAAELAPKLLPRLETWRDIAKTPISAEDNKAIARPIFEGTLMWTRDDAGNPVRAQSLADAAKMIDSRYESQMLKPGIVWTDAELRSIFELNDEQVGLYQEFRAATNRSLDTMARADMLRFGGEDVKGLRDAVMDAPDVRAAATMLRDHLAQMANSWPDRATQLLQAAQGMMDRADKVSELQGEGYAPLSRFGKYSVDVVENGERQYFGLFETKREANKMAEQMRAEFGQDSVTQGTLSDEAFKLFAGITPESLELFGNMLGLDSTGDTAQDQAFQEYLRLTKTNRSAMRRLIHRKGIAGYSEDVGRVLASFVYSNARQTAAGLHMGDLADAVNKIPKEQGELKDAAVRLSEYIKNPQEEAQAVRGLLFAQYLGGSVASAFVNMTQPFAVSFPWLSQHGGARKAASELTRAAKQMATKGHQYEADLAVALKDAEDDGIVSPQEVHQLMAQARGSGSLRAGDGTRAGEARAVASNAVARLSVAWGKLFGAAEQMNRRVTFIAAYRLAKSQGMRDPASFARHAVKETQFIYSKASKMQWGRGAIGGTLMTFKTYSVAYMELMTRLWTQGEPGSQERKEGRKAALLMIATLMLMGGAGGLPFAKDVEDLIDGLAQLAGYNFSTQKAKEEFLASVFGEEIARVIDKGVSGLPGAPMDVSGRLGLGNLIPGTGLFQERTSHTRDVLEIAGPMGDFANRIATGSRKILGGDVGSGLLEMSPVAVRNLAKGADMSVTGMYRDTKGYKVLDTNVLEAALKSLGFQPESVARVQEANWLNQRSKAFYNMKAQEIRAMWAAGIFEKDDAKVQRARDGIADWNAKNPEQPMLIRIPDIMRRVREMSKTKGQRIADTAPRAMRVQMREDVARLRSTMED